MIIDKYDEYECLQIRLKGLNQIPPSSGWQVKNCVIAIMLSLFAAASLHEII
jgi:hypothetical protein